VQAKLVRRRSLIRAMSISCTFFVSLGGTAVAQSGPSALEESALDQSERQRHSILHEFRRIDAATEASMFRPFDSSRRVAFSEVLESPDDPELNFRWAQTQVADGNLTGACATLQRLILNQPDLQRVRLFYAIVLFRLGNLPEADIQLSLVEKSEAADLTPSLRDQAASYRSQIRTRSRRTRHSLLVSGGSTYDSNKNSGPISDQISLLDTRISLGSANRKQSDSGWFSVAQWTTEHDLGHQEERQLVGTAAYFHAQQDDFRLFDVQALRFEAGLRTRRSGSSLHPRVVADLIDLSRENYLRSVGLELEAQRPLSARMLLTSTARVTHEDFDGTPDAATASERSGYRSVLDSEMSFVLSPYQRVALGAQLTHKSADQTYHAYSGWKLQASHQWTFPSGLFVASSASLGFDRYKKNQDSISTSKRRDLRTRARVSLGIPFATLVGSRIPSLRDLVFSIGGEAQINRSNLPNYAFRNRKLTLMLTKPLSF